MELKDKVFGNSMLETTNNNIGRLKFQYPAYNAPCIKTQFYAFDANNEVIESFTPKYTPVVDLMSSDVDLLETYEYIFSMGDLELLGCKNENVQCSTGDQCTKYTCPIEFHFYYNNEQEFATKQKEYEYTKENSQAIFKSSINIVINKQTLINTAIKTTDLDSVCTGICKLDSELELTVLMKTDINKEYETLSDMSTMWGQLVYFQIKGDTDSQLNLVNVVAIVGEEKDIFILGELFIQNFVNITKESQGILEFSVKINAEAQLSPDQTSTLAFVIETGEPQRLRLLATDDLPKATIAKKELKISVPTSTSANQLFIGILSLIFIFLFN